MPDSSVPNPKRLIAGHPCVTLFLFALSLRLTWIFFFHNAAPIEDADSYLRMAKGLAETGEYRLDGRLTAYWPVGYPFFLSWFYHGIPHPLMCIRLSQACLSAASCALLLKLALRATQGETNAWRAWPSAALAVFPTSVSLCNLFFSETLFSFLILAAFYAAAIWKRRGRPIAGLLLAAAFYVRPVAIVLAPLLYFPEAIKGRWKSYALSTAGVVALGVLCALPWTMRNERVFGAPLMSTNFGVNLYIGHHDGATGSYCETPDVKTDWPPGVDEAELSRAYTRRACAYMRAHPREEFGAFAKKMVLLLGRDLNNVLESFAPPENGVEAEKPLRFNRWEKFFAALNNAFHIGLLLAFLAVPWWKRPARQPVLLTAGIIFWVQIIFYAIFFAADRYFFPALPFALLAVSLHQTKLKKFPSHHTYANVPDWTERREEIRARRRVTWS